MKKRKISGQVQVYSRNTRDQLTKIGKFVFKQEGLENIFRDVYSCVDELVKNAVKANYKFVMIVNYLQKIIASENPTLSQEAVFEKVDDIIKHRETYDSEAAIAIKNEKISSFVRETLTEEGMHIRIKNKAYEQHRNLTSDEIEKLKNLHKINMVRRELDEHNVKVLVSFEVDAGFIYIEVTNTAPILESDLNRIYAKRDEFRNFSQQGKQQDFFLNNLDTSESGFGLGYATIDSYLTDLGLDPYQTIQIIAASDTTVILSLHLDVLRDKNKC